MKRIFFLFSVVFSLLFSCNEKDSNHTASIKLTTYLDSIQEGISEYYDTLLLSGYYVKYVIEKDSQLYIQWGKGNKSSFLEPRDYDEIKLQFEVEFSDYLGLKEVCGSPCWGLKLLPKKAIDTILFYSFPIAYDSKNDLLLWHQSYYGKEYIVDNLKTKKRIKIYLDDFSPDKGMFECIDSLSFKNKKLYIRWEIGSSDHPKLKEQNFSFD
jgi:hypothetical protein